MAAARSNRPLQQRIKRAFDVVASTASLIVISPLFLSTVLAVKLRSHGPIFLTAHENCYNRQSIPVLKFQIGDPGSAFARLLIESGLERLPMLINVLRGDMSIVGTHVAVEPSSLPTALLARLYTSPFKPGLISLEIPDDYPDSELKHVEADVFYVSNWSLWLDAKVLFLYLVSKAAYV